MLYPLAIYPFLRIFPKNGRNYTVHPIKSFVLPALLHMIRFTLANNIWNRCMFFAIPRYTTFEYPICFFTMRNGCSTLQRTADFSCSIFLSQLRLYQKSYGNAWINQRFPRNASISLYIAPQTIQLHFHWGHSKNISFFKTSPRINSIVWFSKTYGKISMCLLWGGYNISKRLNCVSFNDSTFLIVMLSPPCTWPHKIGDNGSYLSTFISTLFEL